MGCTGSKFDDLPVLGDAQCEVSDREVDVAGHQEGLVVLPKCEIYLKQDLTVLKLREKFFSFSGDDCTVRDMEGRDWFKIEGSALSITSQRTMTNSEGRVIAGYRKKLLSLYATAYITIELGGQILILNQQREDI